MFDGKVKNKTKGEDRDSRSERQPEIITLFGIGITETVIVDYEK